MLRSKGLESVNLITSSIDKRHKQRDIFGKYTADSLHAVRPAKTLSSRHVTTPRMNPKQVQFVIDPMS